jgi:cation diffusion facilitator CzcD-associated flavoprotein CzcO
MHLTNSPLTKVTPSGVQDASGNRYPADVIILATGFQIGGHLAKLDIKGVKGTSLQDYWTEKKAASTYRSAVVSQFPNFFMLAGPNSASGLFSVLYAVECQVEFACKLVTPFE